MYYILALLLPPLASHKCGRAHFMPCLVSFIMALLLPFFGRSLLVSLLLLPASGALMIISVVFAIMDAHAFYREGRVALITEAIRRSQSPDSVALKPGPKMPDNYDAERDIWRIN